MLYRMMYFFNLVDDWRADGYRWSQNGTKMIPKHDPKIRKVYFVALLPNGNDNHFKKHAYFLLDFDKAEVVNVVLIHYVGDESIAVDFPHGNSKSGMNFYRTCPSVLSKIQVIFQGIYIKPVCLKMIVFLSTQHKTD